jgi:hypothetical protein
MLFKTGVSECSVMELVAVHDLLEYKDTIVDLCIQILNWEWPRSDTIRRRGLLSSSPSLPTNLVLIQRFPRPPAPAVLGHARIRCLGIYLLGVLFTRNALGGQLGPLFLQAVLRISDILE